jgi:MFS family permease
MLGVLAFPAIAYTLMVIGISESPRWLITRKNKIEEAKEIMHLIGVENPDEEVRSILASNLHEASVEKDHRFFSKAHKKIIYLAFMIAFFNQLSGINFILYYAPEILEKAGLAARESLFNSIAIGGTNLIFTFVGLYLIDRLGRKKLLLIGSIGYIFSLAMVAYAFYSHAGPVFLMSFLLLFIAAHAVGQGAVIWVFISEIFPNKIRGAGQSFGASVHWVFAAIITLITPVFLDAGNGIFKDNPWPIFAFFAGMMVLQLIWVLTSMPETKGISLEELEKKLLSKN